MTDFLGPVIGRSAPEAIVRQITEAIRTGALVPGARLPTEAEFAHQLGVAPMTLRAALATLREMGFIETRRGRRGGSYVRADVGPRSGKTADGSSPLTLTQLRDLTDWRRAVSGEAAALAAIRGSAEQYETIQTAAEAFDSHIDDLAQRRQADTRVHTLIARASGSATLLRQEVEIQEALSSLFLSLPRIVTVDSKLKAGHKPLVRAIASHRAEQARTEMLVHAESTFDWCYAGLVQIAHIQPAEQATPLPRIDDVSR